MTSKVNKLLVKNKNKFISVSFEPYKDENEFLNYVAELLKNGADIIELNGANHSAKEVIIIGKKLRELTSVFEALLLVFDRVDIAKLIEADGITLDDKSISIIDANKLCENGMVIGYYANDEVSAIEAEKSGADFIIANKSLKCSNIAIFITK